jgi:glucose-6-phosphate 1-dehydrogenase
VARRVYIDNWRWAGVPFFLRLESLPKRASEISVQLKRVPPILFNKIRPRASIERVDGPFSPTKGSPSESSKVPGPRVRIHPVNMDFDYGSTFSASSPEA